MREPMHRKGNAWILCMNEVSKALSFCNRIGGSVNVLLPVFAILLVGLQPQSAMPIVAQIAPNNFIARVARLLRKEVFVGRDARSYLRQRQINVNRHLLLHN